MVVKKSAKSVKKSPAKKSAPKKKQAITQKPTAKKAIKKVVKPAAKKKTTTKSTPKKSTKLEKDYFKLPFEVYYSECVGVTQYEFKSDIKTTRFADVKAVHMEQGRSWGALFSCDKNKGPELYCCLMDSHDEVDPSWLSFQEEDDISFNYGCDYAVKVKGNEIKFVSLTEEQEDEDAEEFLNVSDMDYCCSYAFMAYEIGETCPDYIILDAGDSRIKIDLDGYELDDENNRIKSRRIINTEDLDHEKYGNYETLELWDAKSEWVKSIIKKDFPKDKNLSLAWPSE